MPSLVGCEICRQSTTLWANIDSYDHYRCDHCCHLFVHPKPSQHDLDALYCNGRYYDKAEAEQGRLLHEASQRLGRLKRLCVRFGLSRRVLDVGCASGYFMRQAVAAGWKTTGVDRSVDIAKRARESSG